MNNNNFRRLDRSRSSFSRDYNPEGQTENNYRSRSSDSRGYSSSRGSSSKDYSDRGYGDFRGNSGGYRGGRSGGRNRGFGGGGRSSRGRGGPARQKIDFNKYARVATPVTMEEYNASFVYADLPILDELKSTIAERGYISPTPIQDQSIPHILEGKDVLGLAATGTGKTAAFLIPLINQCLLEIKERRSWQCLIVAPTRELATQIEEELIKLTKREMRIFSTTLVGGKDIRRQIQRLKIHNHFLVGTPGRLVDLIHRGSLKLENTQAVVLDEVDRMVDMGFLEDITFLIDKLPKKRQSLFFSATLDKKLESVVHSFLTDPVVISLKTANASVNVHQDVVHVNGGDKFQALVEILQKPECSKALIFAETKSFTERLYEDLHQNGYSVESIHGDKTTSFRKRALENFKNNKVKILVATDVAARGIDVDDITHVINFDEPRDYATYIHRIGRAGRAGRTGWAYTLV